jgi:Zn-dependent peptidase ImmA (M78 family)
LTNTLRRGFKAEANDIAQEVRGELRLSPIAPLSPWKLAEHLAIPVWELGTLAGDCPGAVECFSGVDSSAFSAVTVFRGNERVIVHNDSHVPGRQASNLAHELSHALLQHPSAPALNELGCRDWDPILELEASWLGGALLIPDRAALLIARRAWSDQTAAAHFGVTPTMVRYRMNVTAALRRVQRRSPGQDVALPAR